MTWVSSYRVQHLNPPYTHTHTQPPLPNLEHTTTTTTTPTPTPTRTTPNPTPKSWTKSAFMKAHAVYIYGHYYILYSIDTPPPFVMIWKPLPRHWLFVRIIHRPPVNYHHKGQWRGALMFFVVFFYLRPNKWLSKQLWGWWFVTPSRPFWCHCNGGNLCMFPGARWLSPNQLPHLIFVITNNNNLSWIPKLEWCLCLYAMHLFAIRPYINHPVIRFGGELFKSYCQHENIDSRL